MLISLSKWIFTNTGPTQLANKKKKWPLRKYIHDKIENTKIPARNESTWMLYSKYHFWIFIYFTLCSIFLFRHISGCCFVLPCGLYCCCSNIRSPRAYAKEKFWRIQLKMVHKNVCFPITLFCFVFKTTTKTLVSFNRLWMR